MNFPDVTLLSSLPYVFRILSLALLSRLLLLFAFTRLAVFLCTLVSSPLLCWLHRNGKVCANLHRCPLITFPPIFLHFHFTPTIHYLFFPFLLSPLVSVSALILCNDCHYLSCVHLFLQRNLTVAMWVYSTLLCVYNSLLIQDVVLTSLSYIDKIHIWTLSAKIHPKTLNYVELNSLFIHQCIATVVWKRLGKEHGYGKYSMVK